jgi:hypothetical protein
MRKRAREEPDGREALEAVRGVMVVRSRLRRGVGAGDALREATWHAVFGAASAAPTHSASVRALWAGMASGEGARERGSSLGERSGLSPLLIAVSGLACAAGHLAGGREGTEWMPGALSALCSGLESVELLERSLDVLRVLLTGSSPADVGRGAVAKRVWPVDTLPLDVLVLTCARAVHACPDAHAASLTDRLLLAMHLIVSAAVAVHGGDLQYSPSTGLVVRSLRTPTVAVTILHAHSLDTAVGILGRPKPLPSDASPLLLLAAALPALAHRPRLLLTPPKTRF